LLVTVANLLVYGICCSLHTNVYIANSQQTCPVLACVAFYWGMAS